MIAKLCNYHAMPDCIVFVSVIFLNDYSNVSVGKRLKYHKNCQNYSEVYCQ